ncbi:hypothetical protein [Streptomyces sp. NPDC046939]|uniref:hypothetical protein n=1 Tax=Streptomyces sp. NPDC046939 TaxID=3155376 RepID=UPI0033C3E7F0
MPDRSLRQSQESRESKESKESDEGRSSGASGETGTSGDSGDSGKPGKPGTSGADNPFAPPPEDAPDRPWQPRRPEGSDTEQGGHGGGRSPWGSQWSDRQPGPSQGGGRFGDRPGGNGGGQGGPEGQGPGRGTGGMRWDPTDPAQRRARYALLSGMWGFFFALFAWPYVALLLGALALYWSISALRAKPRTPDPDTPAPPAKTDAASSRPQTTAAISGLVTGALALAMVASMFTAKLVYSDYYECRADALTHAASESCEDHLPKQLRPLLGSR